MDCSDGEYIAVVCVTLYFMMLRLYEVNAKEVPWEQSLTYH